MINQQVLDYIIRERRSGKNDKEIHEDLIKVGWEERDIADSFDSASRTQDVIPTPMNTTFLTVSPLSSRAWLLFKTHFTSIMKYCSLPGVLLVGIYGAFFYQFFSTLKDYQGDDPNLLISPYISFGFNLIFIVFGGFIFNILILILAGKEQLSFHALYSKAFRLLPRAILIYIIFMMATYGGFILLIVPGIIFMYSLYFAPFAYVDQGLSIRDSLLYSRAYSRGRIGGIFGRFFLLGLAFFGAAIPVFVMFSVLSVFFGNAAMILVGIAYVVFYIFVVVFFSIFTYVMYQNLRELTGPVVTTNGGRFYTWMIIAVVLGVLGFLGQFSLNARMSSAAKQYPTPANNFTPPEATIAPADTFKDDSFYEQNKVNIE